MRACRHIRQKLSAYQDGEVEGAQKEVIDTHLHACEACRRRYGQLQETCQGLKRLPDIEASANLVLGIFARTSQAHISPWQRFTGYRWRLLPVSAAMVSLAVAGLWIGLLMGHFWIEQGLGPFRRSVAFPSDHAITIASLKAFDAAPDGSFAAGYLQLTAYRPEARHAK
jgi:predicted anti-sigma-YlaC factor YlaD